LKGRNQLSQGWKQYIASNLVLYKLRIEQHFSLTQSQTIDFTGIFTDFKSVSNSEFYKAFV